MTDRWDETFHRLLGWTNGQGPSERLAAQVLAFDGFEEIDPSHPLGGRDGGKDALVKRKGKQWIMAVYFPRNQKSFEEIKKKFLHDLDGLKRNNVERMVFVTNQELKVAERQELHEAAKATEVALYHLEKVVAILDNPVMHPVRKQFLAIDLDDPSPLLRIRLANDGNTLTGEIFPVPEIESPYGKEVKQRAALNKLMNVRQIDPTYNPLYDRVDREELVAFNQAIDRYPSEYIDTIDKVFQIEEINCRTLSLKYFLHNDGNRPASNIKIEITGPSGTEFLSELDEYPDPPALPKKPLSDFEASNWEDDEEDYLSFAEDEAKTARPSKGSASKKSNSKQHWKCAGNTAMLKIARLQHEEIEQLPEIFLHIGQFSKQALEIQQKVKSDELSSQVETLDIHIHESGDFRACFRNHLDDLVGPPVDMSKLFGRA